MKTRGVAAGEACAKRGQDQNACFVLWGLRLHTTPPTALVTFNTATVNFTLSVWNHRCTCHSSVIKWIYLASLSARTLTLCVSVGWGGGWGVGRQHYSNSFRKFTPKTCTIVLICIPGASDFPTNNVPTCFFFWCCFLVMHINQLKLRFGLDLVKAILWVWIITEGENDLWNKTYTYLWKQTLK